MAWENIGVRGVVCVTCVCGSVPREMSYMLHKGRRKQEMCFF